MLFRSGLSYTSFVYGKARVNSSRLSRDGKIICSLEVKNTGTRAGSEVVQLYISDKKSSLPRPPKELKGFTKVSLEPGETKVVEFTIDNSLLQFYDDKQADWVSEPGAFEALIGSSSSDIKTKVKFELK